MGLFAGGRLYPRPTQSQEANQTEDGFATLGATGGRVVDDDFPGMIPLASTSGSSTVLGNDEGFAEGDGDEDTGDSIIVPQPTPSTSKSNGFNLPSLLESDDSELEDFLDDILERGKNTLKKGTVTKLPSSVSSGYELFSAFAFSLPHRDSYVFMETFFFISNFDDLYLNCRSISQAIDARLEYGVEAGVEISLRRLSMVGAYNLPLSIINATVQVRFFKICKL